MVMLAREKVAPGLLAVLLVLVVAALLAWGAAALFS